MRFTATILFILPSAVLWLAWKRHFTDPKRSLVPQWRLFSGTASLVFAICTTLLALAFFYSWFYNGGSPHGGLPPAGIWTRVGKLTYLAFAITVLVAVFGKGRSRLMLLMWALSLPVVSTLLFMLEMD